MKPRTVRRAKNLLGARNLLGAKNLLGVKKLLALIAVAAWAVAVVPGAASARGPESFIEPWSYPTMAPFERYLMDQNLEAALARAAAPAAVAKDATIMVLTQYGYVIAVEGKNGYVCLVARSWLGPFDTPGFWNPQVLKAVMLDPKAVRFLLPILLRRTELVIMGYPKADIMTREKAARDKLEQDAGVAAGADVKAGADLKAVADAKAGATSR